MPLSLSEFTRIVQMLQSMVGTGTLIGAGRVSEEDRAALAAGDVGRVQAMPADMVTQSLDRFSITLDKLVTALMPIGLIGEQMLKAMEQGESAAPKRTRKPAAASGNGSQQPASAPVADPLAAAPAPQQPAMPPALQVAPPSQPAQGEMPDLPAMLDRRPQAAPAAAAATVSPVPDATPAATPADGLTEDKVKAVLRQYMNKFGPDGGEKMAVLLQKYGTTQFSTLARDKWAAIVTEAQQELML